MTNEQVALWMGWTPCDFPMCDGTCIPDFSQEGQHWPYVYAEIERRGLRMAYRWHLSETVKPRAIALWNEYPEESFDCSMAYAMATAAAAERLAALAKVIEEEKTNG